jgi:hypothetical protein
LLPQQILLKLIVAILIEFATIRQATFEHAQGARKYATVLIAKIVVTILRIAIAIMDTFANCYTELPISSIFTIIVAVIEALLSIFAK